MAQHKDWIKTVVLNRGYQEPKQGVRSTKIFRDMPGK